MSNTILIVAAGTGFLISSIRENLESASYRVIMAAATMEAVSEVKTPICCIVIYCDDNLNENDPSLYFLKDLAIAENTPIVAIGEAAKLGKIKTAIPSTLIRFEFARPINVRSLVETVVHFLQSQSMQNKKKILVVDDSGAMLRSVKGWLEDQYDVFLANSGAMAIKYLTLNRPDLVLLDYEMPVVDGKQVLEMIRTETDFSNIPVIFLTAKGDKESIAKVMDLKPEGYLLKTLEPAQIVDAVNVFFSKQKALI